MSAYPALPESVPATTASPARIALLGTGTVGRAVLARLAAWRGTSHGASLALCYVANSREAFRPDVASRVAAPGDAAASPRLARIGTAMRLPRLADVFDAGDDVRIVLDATASDAVAAQHAHWLAQGVHVVTACKLGAGTTLSRWRDISAAAMRGGATYGDSATVGAGLPLLRSLRALQAGGDRIHAVAGVLSGSLAWLFHQYDGMRPFSALVRQAREAGYTEPDPRDDLSGEDVRRKLLILARAAGRALDARDVDVESLVPATLASAQATGVDDALASLDVPLRARHAAAWKEGAKLRYVARLDARGRDAQARVGLEALAADDPLVGGAGSDNRVAIWSDRYARQPLVIQGPGAGAAVTAAAMLDDTLRIAADRAYAAGASSPDR